METSFRLPRPTSAPGWCLYPVRWVLWRLNKPVHDQLLHQVHTTQAQMAQLVQHTRTHVDSVNAHVAALQRHAEGTGARLDAVQQLTDYLRTHADNILGLVRNGEARAEALQQHADNVLALTRNAEGQANAAFLQADAAKRQVEGQCAALVALLPPQAISPLLAQAAAVDHLALTRRIGMLENLLVEVQARLPAEDAGVLPLPLRRAS